MKWLSKRISFNDQKKFLTIVIYPHNNTLVNTLMGAWLGMWVCIGVTLISCLFILELNQQEKIIIYVFLTFWSYYLYRVSSAFLWRINGKELIKLDEIGMHIKKSVFGYGKSEVYYYDQIEPFTIKIIKKKTFEAVWESSPWVKGMNSIYFNYKTKNIGFGRKIEKEEAKLLIKLINRKKSEYKFKEKKVVKNL